MSMVTLSHLLNPQMNLKGLVPTDIMCIPRQPDHGDMKLKVKRKPPVLANVLVEDFLRDDLGVPLYKPIRLADFIKISKVARAYEWHLDDTGCLVHYPFGLFEMYDVPADANPFTTLDLLQLDITEWLRLQPDKTLQELCRLAFAGYLAEGTATLYKTLGRTPLRKE